MSLYNKASLIQVPSLYKDGLLVSTVPEDRSGDFTVARGSNLSATRIGEDGYIKKGYENLLLQSNSFDTTWGIASNLTLTSGYSGYDGSNDAWKAQFNGPFKEISQTVSFNGISTFSIYAKAGDTEWIRLTTTGSVSTRVFFNILPDGNGDIGLKLDVVDASIEYISNGWYRCSVVVSGSINSVRIIGAVGNNNTNTNGEYCYIQDAQLNQGLVAYPYLETTIAPAQGGLLENTPRLDWSNGVAAVLVEESRTNLIGQSEYITIFSSVTPTYNNTETLSPEGLYNAIKAEATGSNPRVRSEYPASDGVYTLSLFAKEGTSSFLLLRAYDRTNNHEATFDLTDGTFSGETTGVTAYSEDYGNGWYRCAITYTSAISDTGLNYAQAYVSNGSTGNIYVYGYQAEQSSTPSSYIPTYGTSQTRSNETVSDTFSIPTTATIYNSFYAPASEQVYVLDQVFSVSKGLNKVAIAFSPTAIKISVGGAIVASSTGSYDTTSLTSISLGSDSGADYSNAPISGFYIFPEFLTDDELNSLTA